MPSQGKGKAAPTTPRNPTNHVSTTWTSWAETGDKDSGEDKSHEVMMKYATPR